MKIPPSAVARAGVLSRAPSVALLAALRALLLALVAFALAQRGQGAAPVNPILYVTQAPITKEVNSRFAAQSFMGVAGAFSNHLGDTPGVGRGGALMIRYADGTVRNLTAAAQPTSYGTLTPTGLQTANGIAVRNPCLHSSGTKALFSMVVGAPANASDTTRFYWQIYEISNFTAANLVPTITKVPFQPATYNNVNPIYGSDGRIIFSSDQPHNATPQADHAHLYPQREEYLLLPTVTGLWSLDPVGGDLFLLDHSPSGSFSPIIDSFGRLIFIRWDHLSRDVEAVTDRAPVAVNGDNWTQTNNGCGNFSSEAANATFTTFPGGVVDTYPEPRNSDHTSLLGTNMNGNTFNIFFIWQMNQDGTNQEMLNHVGRHELLPSFTKSFTNDPNLVDFAVSGRNSASNFFQVREDPDVPGRFFAVDAPDVGSHMSGRIITLTGPLGANPDTQMPINYITGPVSIPIAGLQPPLSSPVDIFRNPLPLKGGGLVASVTPEITYDSAGPDPSAPGWAYAYRLRALKLSGAFWVVDNAVNMTGTGTMATNLSWYANGQQVTYNGLMWELEPVEVVPLGHSLPTATTTPVDPIETSVFGEEYVDLPTYQNYLRTRGLALSVSRNVTMRDKADKQQPFNLKVAWPTSSTQTLGTASGKVYNIGYMQIFQADLLRGLTMNGNGAPPVAGRRVLPAPLHDGFSENPPTPGFVPPPGGVKIADDGSVAMVVPARRAITYHLTETETNGYASVVKERFWINFAPGEVRTCAVCHGINTANQALTLGLPQNKPQALRSLLQYWLVNNPRGTAQFASANLSAKKTDGTVTVTLNRTGGGSQPLTVHYATADGTAIAGQDYNPITGNVTWLDGDVASKSFTVTVRNNPVIAAPKTFTVSITGTLVGVNPPPTTSAPSTTTVTINQPPFETWLFANLGAAANNPGTGGALGDADGDGFSNLAEYALGTNPSAQTPALQSAYTAGRLGLGFTRESTRTDTTLTVEGSADLQSWSNLARSTGGGIFTALLPGVNVSESGAGSLKAVQVLDAAGTPNRFLRVRVDLN